ncbi:MAG TPA: DUF11 domain-containing protein [Gammaproteobacteria bacterium]|nr:DUF11 domain-containing protein [Gammaproteobacteria bacterium]
MGGAIEMAGNVEVEKHKVCFAAGHFSKTMNRFCLCLSSCLPTLPMLVWATASIILGSLLLTGRAEADILTLHPSGSAPGDNIFYEGGTAADALDTKDDWISYGQTDLATDDFYLEMDNANVSGVINSVVVKAWVTQDNWPSGTSTYRIGVRTNGSEYFGGSINQTLQDFVLQSGDTYTTNPQTGLPWTWAEIDNLVAAVDLMNDNTTRITELYVEIDYTPAISVTLSGTLYSDEGTAPLSGQTVRLLIDGVSEGIDVTDASGNYTITTTVAAGDSYVPLLVYVDNGSVKATTVTVMDPVNVSNTISNLDLYADHLITRQDEGGTPLDNGDISNADGYYGDTDILYYVLGMDLTVRGTNTELYVPTSHSYQPLGNVTTAHIKINGTVTAGSNTFTVSGNWDNTNGTFNADTSTVNFTGTGTISIDVNGWANTTKRFYNVNAAASGQTTTILASRGIVVMNNLTLGGGTLAGGRVYLNRDDGTPFVPGSTTLSNLLFRYQPLTTVNVANANYPDLYLAARGTSTSFLLLGNITCNNLQVSGGSAGKKSILDTTAANYSIDCNQLKVGNSTDTRYGKLILNNSAVTINGNVTIYASDAADTNEIDAGGSTINVGGDWINNDTFTPGTSTVVLNGANQTLSGSTTFRNLTKTVSSADTLTFTAGTTQTITGTATLNGASGQLLSLRSSSPGTRWNLNLATGATKAISYVDVQDSDASGSDAGLLDINPPNSVDSGNNVSWFGSANITASKSSTVISDPVNGTNNPKRIPGAVVEYTITVTNTAGAQATNVTVTDDLSAEAATLAFLADGYAAGKGIRVTAPNINGGATLNLTNVADSDQGSYNSTTRTVTVNGIVLNAGEQAIVSFRVTIQ